VSIYSVGIETGQDDRRLKGDTMSKRERKYTFLSISVFLLWVRNCDEVPSGVKNPRAVSDQSVARINGGWSRQTVTEKMKNPSVPPQERSRDPLLYPPSLTKSS
jgi:hypothetical protein